MASGLVLSLPADTATLVHTAGRHGAMVVVQGGSVFLGGPDVDSSHGCQVGDIPIELGPDESLYAWSGTAVQVQVLVTNDV